MTVSRLRTNCTGKFNPMNTCFSRVAIKYDAEQSRTDYWLSSLCKQTATGTVEKLAKIRLVRRDMAQDWSFLDGLWWLSHVSVTIRRTLMGLFSHRVYIHVNHPGYDVKPLLFSGSGNKRFIDCLRRSLLSLLYWPEGCQSKEWHIWI